MVKQAYGLDLFSFSELNQPEKLIYKKDLIPINNLKIIFRDIRDYFAGNVTGITRDETIAQMMMRLLFCKIFDEHEKKDNELVEIARRPNESLNDFGKRIYQVFEKVKEKYADIFSADEQIDVSPADLSWIIAKIENYSLLDTRRDVIADAFEELIGRTFRGGEGQFFTPRNVVQMMIDVLNPTSNEKIIDPACGSGGFLAYILQHLVRQNAKNYFLAGIDKDAFLSRLAKIYLSLIGENEYHIFCENSLEQPQKWKQATQNAVEFETFDVILTNPPFGAKIPVVGDALLRQYALGHDWLLRDKKWLRTTSLLDKQPPQVLFIERCLQLLKTGGRLGIVLPEGIFGNPSDRYIWEFIQQNASIIGVVSLSQETFQPSTHTKTSVLFLEKTSKSKKPIFMAIANAIGHNKNGKEIFKFTPNGLPVLDKQGEKVLDDDLPNISRNFQIHRNGGLKLQSHLGFEISREQTKSHVFIPEYYNPEIIEELKNLEAGEKYRLVSINELLREKIIEVRRGNEIGSRFYGSGTIPFVRTTDIVNWEIKFDPIKAVSEEVYQKYQSTQDIKENDILLVNDGTFLIGRTAIVTRLDEKIIIQSHLRKFRVLQSAKLNPFYLFYLLNTKIVRKQIESKTFVQATISTIGNRLGEILLPFSRDEKQIRQITSEIREIIEEKTVLREKCVKIIEESI